MSKTNIILTQKQLDGINIIGDFLAMRDEVPDKVDAVILLGSSLINHLEMVSAMYHLGRFKKLFIVGGIGHSTKFLYENLEASILFKKYLDKNQSEADIYSKILTSFYQIPEESIIIENQSSNCGNNASYAYKIASNHGLSYKHILLIQDPTMQRRSYASFLREWKNKQVTFLNYAPIVPELAMDCKGQIYFKEPLNPPWTIERYVELVMGEIPRLRDDANGYGPKGAGYIVHVDIPNKVEQAYQFLEESFFSF